MRPRNDSAFAGLLALAGCMVLVAATPDLDPLTIADDDFARHRNAAEWQNLSVSRIVFTEGAATWRLWRIVNLRKPDGPLWVVTHDNENATFAAALVSLHAWGGVAMVVDTGASDSGYDARFNRTAGSPIDPNRNFRDALPLYAGQMLTDLGSPPRLIVALHTNEPGFAPGLPGCGRHRGTGTGTISIRLCSDRFHPSASRLARWPFDDEDSVALVPYLAARDPATAWCAKPLMAADYNIVFERVAQSDGSLSNYAVQHGLNYINLETLERGSDPVGIASSRDRLVTMIDGVMARCGNVAGVTLRLPRFGRNPQNE